MSEDIPYFRFTVSEWLTGDITLESDEVQGQFINVCCYYWQNDCSIAKAKLERRLNGGSASLDYMIEKGVVKHDPETDEISISFLDEQWGMLSDLRKKRQKAGKKGGLQKASRAKAKLKQKPSYKEKNKDKEKNNTKKSKVKYLEALNAFRSDPPEGWVERLSKEHPRLNIRASLRKIYDYWCTDEGYQKKQKTKAENIDWAATFKNGLNQDWNQVVK